MQTMHNQSFSFYRQYVFTLCENIFAHCLRGRLSCADMVWYGILEFNVPLDTV